MQINVNIFCENEKEWARTSVDADGFGAATSIGLIAGV